MIAPTLFKGRHQGGDVTHHEQLARRRRKNRGGVRAAVGTRNDHRFWPLTFGQRPIALGFRGIPLGSEASVAGGEPGGDGHETSSKRCGPRQYRRPTGQKGRWPCRNWQQVALAVLTARAMFERHGQRPSRAPAQSGDPGRNHAEARTIVEVGLVETEAARAGSWAGGPPTMMPIPLAITATHNRIRTMPTSSR